MLRVERRRQGRGRLLQQYGEQLSQMVAQNQAELSVTQGVQLRRLDATMRSVVQHSFDGILAIRGNGGIEMANDAALRAFGYGRADLRNSHVSCLMPEVIPADGDLADLFQLGHGHREALGHRKDGSTFPMELAISDCHLGEDRLFIAIVRDITDRKAQEERLQYQALHDALTGLPNRTLLIDRMKHAIDMARRQSEPLALLLLDLDRFKEINDTLGHQVGDLLLRDVAKRLMAPLRQTDTIARLGGDEFAVLLPAVTDLARAQRVASRIRRSLDQPFQLESLSLEVGISIGIAMFPDHAEDDDKLLQCADVAMYAAKKAQSDMELYDSCKDQNSVRHLTLSGELRQAIESGQLSFHYQPKLDLTDGQIHQVEALARWNHPKLGFIPPEEFILQAERTGLIQSLILWEFDTALGQIALWRERGLDLGVAINLSAGNLHHETLPGVVAEMLDKWRVEPARLTLEVTESAIMIDPQRAEDVLARLDDIGLRLSIDDFGTGYSSLASLKSMPVDELKIDKSFVIQMTADSNDEAIVRSTIELAHNLGLKVVAEGVESAEHIALLRGLGCDLGQGFFIGEPLPGADLAAWLRRGTESAAETAPPPRERRAARA